jgi:hypothetical protein
VLELCGVSDPVADSESVGVLDTDDVTDGVASQLLTDVTVCPHMVAPAVLMHFGSDPSIGVLHQ